MKKILLLLSGVVLCAIGTTHIESLLVFLPFVAIAGWRMFRGENHELVRGTGNTENILAVVALFCLFRVEILQRTLPSLFNLGTPTGICATLVMVALAVPFAWWLNRDAGSPFTPDARFDRLCFALSWTVVICGLGVLIASCFTRNIWLEETYSLAMIDREPAEIPAMCLTDAHPPLYYIGLHLFAGLLSPVCSAVCAGKIFAVIPFAVMTVLFLTVVRRRYGKWVGMISAASLFGMPHIIYYGGEIRMYGWAAMWILVSVICLGALMEKRCRHPYLNMAMLVIATAAASYTHHYACLASFGVFLGWMIWVIATHPPLRRGWLPWLICATLSIAAYLPLLHNTLHQIGFVSREFWLPQPSRDDIVGFVMYLYGNLIVLLLCLHIMVHAIRRIRRTLPTPQLSLAMTAIFIPLLLLCAGLAVSLLVRPVLMPRYLLPAMPGMWLGFAILARHTLHDTRIQWWLAIALFLFSAADIGYFALREYKTEQGYLRAVEYLQEHKDALMICDSTDSGMEIQYILGNGNVYLWDVEIDPHIRKLYGFGNPGAVQNVREVAQLIQPGHTVLWVAEQNKPLDTDSLFRNSGMHLEQCAEIQPLILNKVYEIHLDTAP